MTGADPSGATRLVARGLTDVRSFREVIWPAFRQHDPTATELDYRQDVDVTRLRREVGQVPPGERPDALILADPLLFARDGLLSPLEATTPDPGVPAWQDPSRRWATVYVQPIVATYNALYRRPPRSWLELADEAWHDRLVVEAPVRMLTTGPAFAELRGSMGEPAWSAWLARLAKAGMHQVGDNERAILEVATGSRWGGLANWNVARRVRPGSPVRHVFLDPTPIVPAFAAVVAGGRSPALGHRFVTWLASADGQAAVARTGRIPALGLEEPSSPSRTVIPASIGRLAGTADWVTEPDHWIEAFARIFPPPGAVHAGKRHA